MNVFSAVNVTFYEAVNMIHDSYLPVFPDTSKFMFVGVGNNTTQQVRVER